jgi:hypothetical protein
MNSRPHAASKWIARVRASTNGYPYLLRHLEDEEAAMAACARMNRSHWVVNYVRWVISGLSTSHHSMSALPLKADIAQHGRLRPLSATSGHR